MPPVIATLITGFAGAGKTTLLRTLLEQRPPDERWAVLLNGSGDVASSDTITVQRLIEGCACCSARVPFRTALVQLLRAAHAQRVLIELAGAGDPAGVKAVLGEAAIARAVTLRSTLCVINPRDLADARITAREIYLAQLRHADHFILAGDTGDCAEARIALARLGVAGTAIILLQDAGAALLNGGELVQGAVSHGNRTV